MSKRLGTIKGKALVRVDINVPVRDGKVSSNNLRFKACAKSIDTYVSNGIIPIIIAHQGRKGDDDYLERMDQHAEVLGSMVKKANVIYSNSLADEHTSETASKLKEGDVLVLNNIRDHPDEKRGFNSTEELSNCELVRSLSKVADFYINDAPATMHRADASLIGFRYVMPSYLGVQMEDELGVLQEMKEKIDSGKEVVIIFGGKKWEKFDYIYKIAKNKNVRILCGGIPGQSISYIKNKRRFNKENEEFLLTTGSLDNAERLVKEFSERILYPSDFILDSGESTGIERLIDRHGVIMDIGEETLNRFFDAIEETDTIIYAGPVGRYEMGYNQTIRLVTRFMGLKAHNYTLGGNSADSMDDIGLEVAYGVLGGKRITSGGSGLAFLADEDLPVIKAFSTATQ